MGQGLQGSRNQKDLKRPNKGRIDGIECFNQFGFRAEERPVIFKTWLQSIESPSKQGGP
jgi:hypothetical protein